jgi:hypothetical protein
MYNRYIPQADGSYRRNRMEDKSPEKPTPTPPEPPCEPQPPNREPPRHDPVSGFLRQLLPKDFDTGDLIVILLLLLMAGDCEEDRNNAILTIALYFLM